MYWTHVGYKAFLPVLTANSGVDITELRKDAIQKMKTQTANYVPDQIAWITSKLIPACLSNNLQMPIYVLDATDPSQWSSKVMEPAICVARGNL